VLAADHVGGRGGVGFMGGGRLGRETCQRAGVLGQQRQVLDHARTVARIEVGGGG